MRSKVPIAGCKCSFRIVIVSIDLYTGGFLFHDVVSDAFDATGRRYYFVTYRLKTATIDSSNTMSVNLHRGYWVDEVVFQQQRFDMMNDVRPWWVGSR